MQKIIVLVLLFIIPFFCFSQDNNLGNKFSFTVIEYIENKTTDTNNDISVNEENKKMKKIISPIIPYEDIKKKLVYPECLRKNRIEGTVKLRLYISKEGKLIRVKILNKANNEFITAALNALDNVNIQPARTEDGEPINSTFIFPIDFKVE